MNLYVSNLNLTTTDEGLKSAFSGFGQVESAKVIMDRFTGKSKGFGFVEMPDKQEAGNAMNELNGTVDGNTISVVEARPREERTTRNSNFRGDSSLYNKSRW